MTGGSLISGNRHMLMFLEPEDESQDKTTEDIASVWCEESHFRWQAGVLSPGLGLL